MSITDEAMKLYKEIMYEYERAIYSHLIKKEPDFISHWYLLVPSSLTGHGDIVIQANNNSSSYVSYPKILKKEHITGLVQQYVKDVDLIKKYAFHIASEVSKYPERTTTRLASYLPVSLKNVMGVADTASFIIDPPTEEIQESVDRVCAIQLIL